MVDDIASKYIRPDEGTLDFALMYIPAENIYYEIARLTDGDSKGTLGYAIDKKVIPVSPTLLFVYLETIAMGLRGLKIQDEAREILNNLKTLDADFSKIQGAFRKVGEHLKNSRDRYDDASKALEKFGDRLHGAQSLKEPPVETRGEGAAESAEPATIDWVARRVPDATSDRGSQ